MNITAETIQNITGFLPRYSALYRVSGGAFKTLFVSDKLPALLGMTKEEYTRNTENDAMNIVLPQDREGLRAAAGAFLTTGEDLDCYYRVRSNRDGFDWVHAEASLCGEMEGDPVIIARYANMSQEGEIFHTILNNSDRRTIVIDRSTREVLYANEKARVGDHFRSDASNQMCYRALKGQTAPCADCARLSDLDDRLHSQYEYDEADGRWSLVTWKRIAWCMRDAVVVYIQDVTKDKEHEISLDRMNQMYQMAIEDAKEMMWIYDPTLKTITYQVDNPFTREVCEKIGLPTVMGNVPDSLLGMVDEEFRAGFLKMFDVDSLDKKGVKFEYSSTVNGNTQWWRVASRPIYDLNKRIKAVFCSGLNITDEKQAENNYRALLDHISDSSKMGLASFRLNLSRNRLVSGFSIYPEQYALLNRKTAAEHISAAVAEIADEAIRTGIESTFTCDRLMEKYRQGARKITLEYPVRSRLKETSGRIRWIKTTNYLITNPDTGDIEDISIVTDITRQKKNEKMLQVMATKGCDYLCLVDRTECDVEFYSGSWDYDLIKNAGRVAYAEAAGLLIRLHLDSGKRQAFAEQTRLENIIQKLETDNEVVAYYDFVDGGRAPLKKQVKFRWFDEEKQEILVVQDDITEAYVQEQQRVAELKEALDKANLASRAKTEFLSRMSHDIRTPLNGIIGMTYLTKEMELAPEVRENLDKIDVSSKFLLSLVNDVLDMSKAESGKIELHPEPYDAAVFFNYLDSVVLPLCKAKNINFVVDARAETSMVPLLDTLRINQVFFNLLSNAVKFTPEGGTVTYRLREHLAANGRLVMEGEVSDTGVGISEEFQKHLFEPFTQETRNDVSETRGTGLGLAIVKKLLDLMGCEITVQSERGKGSTFFLRGEFDCVPAAVLNGRQAQTEPEQKDTGLAGLHVLLCEDHPLNREIAKTLLNEKQILVSVAEDGRQGLQKFADSAVGCYDAILMDVRMPVMNGLEAARQIRALERADAKSIPIIAMTADAFEDDIRKCLDAGMNGHISKPIDPQRLYGTLAACLNRARCSSVS